MTPPVGPRRIFLTTDMNVAEAAIYLSPGLLRELAAALRERSVTEEDLDFIAMILATIADQGGVQR